MSVDCDCCAVAEDPCIKDIGILASTDAVAIDQACIDLVYAAKYLPQHPLREYKLYRMKKQFQWKAVSKLHRIRP